MVSAHTSLSQGSYIGCLETGRAPQLTHYCVAANDGCMGFFIKIGGGDTGLHNVLYNSHILL